MSIRWIYAELEFCLQNGSYLVHPSITKLFFFFGLHKTRGTSDSTNKKIDDETSNG